MSITSVQNNRRIPELDGIRGIAILMVLVWHYVALGVPIDPSSKLFRVVFYLRNTWAGVDLFFVLSGFLIGGILLDARSSPAFFKTFFLRRIARILPLYILFLLFFAVAQYLTRENYTALFQYLVVNSLPAWTYWTLTQNIFSSFSGSWGSHWHGVTWSLAVEEQFYITLPFIIRFAPPARLPWIIGGCVIGAPLLRTVLYFTLSGGQAFSTYWLMPCRTDALGLGVLGAMLIRSERGKELLREKWFLLWVGLFLGAYAFVYLSMIGQGVGTLHTAIWGHTAFAVLFFSLLMIAVTSPHSIVGWITRLPFLRRLGIIAYGVYLFHYPVLAVVHQYWFGSGPSFVSWERASATFVALVLTVLLSEFSWKYFELPIVKRSQRLTY